MNVFVRAVVSGFGFTLGSALYKRAAKKFGLEDAKKDETDPDTAMADDSDSSDDEEASE